MARFPKSSLVRSRLACSRNCLVDRSTPRVTGVTNCLSGPGYAAIARWNLRATRRANNREASNMAEVHEGGCLCGGARYRVSGFPVSAIVCHCTFCRRGTGSAFRVCSYFDESAVEKLKGELETYEYRSDESNRWIRIEFCPTCGDHRDMDCGMVSRHPRDRCRYFRRSELDHTYQTCMGSIGSTLGSFSD
jgi:hypothetical protein